MPTTVPPTTTHPTSSTEHSDHQLTVRQIIRPRSIRSIRRSRAYRVSRTAIAASRMTSRKASTAGISIALTCVAIAGRRIPHREIHAPESNCRSPAGEVRVPIRRPCLPLSIRRPAFLWAGSVATKEELAKPWASKRFVFHDAGTMMRYSGAGGSSPRRAILGNVLAGAVWRLRTGICDHPREVEGELRSHRVSSHDRDPCNRAVLRSPEVRDAGQRDWCAAKSCRVRRCVRRWRFRYARREAK